jgi:hypothetical protein
VTVRLRDGHATVATTADVALAVDEAQYADDAGPCLDAAAGTLGGIPDTATVVHWPRFREAAQAMGLRSSLSIPLFTASGAPWIGMNLYAHQLAALTSLTGAVDAIYGSTSGTSPTGDAPEPVGDDGSRDLLAGLAFALELRNTVQRAIGVIMGRDRIDSADAYVRLRVEAVEHDQSLHERARSLTGLPQQAG